MVRFLSVVALSSEWAKHVATPSTRVWMKTENIVSQVYPEVDFNGRKCGGPRG